jgi:hypothetical protein
MSKIYRIQVAPELYFPPGSACTPAMVAAPVPACTPALVLVFSILEQLLPVKFMAGYAEKADGAIIKDSQDGPDGYDIPTLSIGLTGPCQPVETSVTFADDHDLPFPFRGRSVDVNLPGARISNAEHDQEKVLASGPQGALWTVSRRGGVRHFRSALPLPQLSDEQGFSDAFDKDCFLEMLVLLEFLAHICKDTAYRHAPLRAAFIIDDPNLHWPRYGYVDYRQLAVRAQRENYHVAFATIPLDAWYTHAPTAAIFRSNTQWLSLLMHGNNHASQELALPYPEAERKGLLQQALQRIERLEQKADIRVSRVMVPPHGACSDEMLAALWQCGFESACISTKSLIAHNPSQPWTKTVGFMPAERINNCPVLPRWGLTGAVRTALLLAAYLGQPMILRVHHQDLRDGVELFDEYARFINGLGEVSWLDMTGLSRLNYIWRMEGSCCRITPLGKYINFEAPRGTDQIMLDGPGAEGVWQAASAGWAKEITPGRPLVLPMHRDSALFFSRAASPVSPFVTASMKPTGAALMLRRFLTETRDRLLCVGGRGDF